VRRVASFLDIPDSDEFASNSRVLHNPPSIPMPSLALFVT
jgi:hypothetical protein